MTARGNRRAPVFHAPLDCYEYLLLLGEAMGAHEDVACHGFCLMPNHVHLVFDAPQEELSPLMRRVSGVYAQRFNRRYRAVGHLWQGRFWSEPIVDDGHLLEVVRYVVLNPVRARICRDAGDWSWSSYAAYFDATAAPAFLTTSFVLELFAQDAPQARPALAQFIEEGRDLAKPVRAAELLR